MCCPENYPFTLEIKTIFELTILEPLVLRSLDTTGADIINDQ
jgi:hypothetical protein